MAWVREHGKVVDPKLWKPEGAAADPEDDPEPKPGDEMPDPARMARWMRRSTQLYDLKPNAGPLESPDRLTADR